MKRVKRSVLVPYPAARMFALVDDVESYPRFLPWCAGAHVLARDDHQKTARLDIDYHGVKAHFTTRNTVTPPERIEIALTDGPFRTLCGQWRFTALGDLGCRVDFELAYEFSTPLLEGAVGPVFGHIARSFTDAFVRRADALSPNGAPG